MKFFYKLRNWRSEIRMFLIRVGVLLGGMFGVLTLFGTISAVVIKANGTRIDLGPICARVVTDAGVAFLVDHWDDNSVNMSTVNFHDSGIGIVAENAADTGLGTPAGPARVAGAKSQPSANVLRTIATIAYTATLAITEHGLFSALTAGTLWDRTVFAAINVVSGDSIQFTYDCTLTAGS